MKSWLTPIGRALMMGFAWFGAWLFPSLIVGRIIVGELEPEMIGGPLYAGVFCGTVFSVLSGLASGRRRLEDMALTQAAAWGALTGVVAGMVLFLVGDESGGPHFVLGVRLPVFVVSCLIALCALTAVVSSITFRWGL